MPHAFTEDQLVEQPAMGLFAQLGWKVALPPPHPGPPPKEQGFFSDETGLFGRETKGEVVMFPGFRAAMETPMHTLALEPIITGEASAPRRVSMLPKPA